MQIMQIETCLQCLSLPRYLFYLQFNAFPKRNDISTRKSQKCAFLCTAAIFSHTTVLFQALEQPKNLPFCLQKISIDTWKNPEYCFLVNTQDSRHFILSRNIIQWATKSFKPPEGFPLTPSFQRCSTPCFNYISTGSRRLNTYSNLGPISKMRDSDLI